MSLKQKMLTNFTESQALLYGSFSIIAFVILDSLIVGNFFIGSAFALILAMVAAYCVASIGVILTVIIDEISDLLGGLSFVFFCLATVVICVITFVEVYMVAITSLWIVACTLIILLVSWIIYVQKVYQSQQN
jgi:peptidoglycan/LPS O-acetylase OafA/YrhL